MYANIVVLHTNIYVTCASFSVIVEFLNISIEVTPMLMEIYAKKIFWAIRILLMNSKMFETGTGTAHAYTS